MPSTVASIFAAAGVDPADVVRWGTSPARSIRGVATGIYVVALTEKLDDVGEALPTAPISATAVDELLGVRPELTLDGARPTRDQLVERLAGFWLPAEVILYIGLAGVRRRQPPEGELARRVVEYYKTRLGARSPHSGGWPLKTLTCLSDLFVHFGYCDRVEKAEHAAMGCFASDVSDATLERLHDRARVMPFANLEFPKGNPKNHGIRGAREPRKPPTVRGEEPSPGESAQLGSTSKPAGRPIARTPAVTAPHRSQNVTAKDIEVGQVRIPIGPTKRILPRTRADITVVLRGRALGACRWDPRYGRDKERSGVIRVGRAPARDLLVAGDMLAISVSADSVVSLD